MFQRNKIVRWVILFAFTCNNLNAQCIDKYILDSYNASVVAKVFSIVKYVEIDKNRQLLLAQSIYMHDSTISSWISLGKSKASIDTLQQLAQFQLYGLLTKEQLQTYKYNSHIEISNAIATGEAEYIKKEYSPDSITYDEIRKSLANKYNYILQNFSDNYLMNQQAAAGYLKKLSAVYDAYKYFPVLYTRKYMDDLVSTIGTINPVDTPTLAKIQHSFYNLVWQHKYSDWSLAAKNAIRMHLPDPAIFAVLDSFEIQQQAEEFFAGEKYNLIFREHVSEPAFRDLETLIKEKSYKRSLLQHTYAAFYPKHFDYSLRQTMKRYDSIIEARLIYDGCLQPNTQFAVALKFKQQLKLRPSLCDTLVQHAMYLAKLRDSILIIDPFANTDYNDYEATHLNQLLTEEQYNTVLFHKTRTYAAFNAQADWKEMVVRGLDRGFLKDETIRQMTEYNIIKNSAWCRYVNDKVRLWANMRALDEYKPRALKLLDPIRWSGATQKSTNDLQLTW